jgi:hypothetical protein
MSTRDPDISHKLVNNIKPSETLSSLLQHAATETRPRATSLEIHEAMTPLRPIPPSIETVRQEFADTGSSVRLERQTSLSRNDLPFLPPETTSSPSLQKRAPSRNRLPPKTDSLPKWALSRNGFLCRPEKVPSELHPPNGLSHEYLNSARHSSKKPHCTS